MLSSLNRSLGVAFAFAFAVAVGTIGQVRSPSEVPLGRSKLSADRMQRTLIEITREPHPVGSENHERVRRYLMGEFAVGGLEVESAPQIEAAVRLGEYRAAKVNNILGWLRSPEPGPRTKPVIAFVAHYDAVAQSHGASDDGAGVATLVELARLSGEWARTNPEARAKLPVELLFLLTDGEEEDLFGAIAFRRSHEAFGRLREVYNFEARGARGPVVMFQTREPNASSIAAYREIGVAPFTHAFISAFSRILPNDTDFTVLKAAPRLEVGLNFAFADDYFRYHTERDSLENLDPKALLHHALQAEGALWRAIRAPEPSTAPGGAGNVVASDWYQWKVFALPISALRVICALAWALAFLGLRRVPEWTWRREACRFALALVCGALGSWILGASERALIGRESFIRNSHALLALNLTALLVITLGVPRLRKGLLEWPPFFTMLTLSLICSWALPEAALTFGIPALFGMASANARVPRALRWMALGFALSQLALWIYMLEVMVGASLPVLTGAIAFAMIVTFAFAGLANAMVNRRTTALLATVMMAVLGGAIGSWRADGPDHPAREPFNLAFDATTGQTSAFVHRPDPFIRSEGAYIRDRDEEAFVVPGSSLDNERARVFRIPTSASQRREWERLAPRIALDSREGTLEGRARWSFSIEWPPGARCLHLWSGGEAGDDPFRLLTTNAREPYALHRFGEANDKKLWKLLTGRDAHAGLFTRFCGFTGGERISVVFEGPGRGFTLRAMALFDGVDDAGWDRVIAAAPELATHRLKLESGVAIQGLTGGTRWVSRRWSE